MFGNTSTEWTITEIHTFVPSVTVSEDVWFFINLAQMIIDARLPRLR